MECVKGYSRRNCYACDVYDETGFRPQQKGDNLVFEVTEGGYVIKLAEQVC